MNHCRIFIPGISRLISMFSAVLFLVLLASCSVQRKAEQLPLEKSLLWEISGPGIKQPSYIFGTIHLIDGSKFFLPPGTMAALEKSKKVVFEIDMNEMSDMSSLMGMMGKIFMKDNLTIKDLLSEDDYSLVKNHFQKIGLPIFMVERMKPMFLSIFSSTDMDPSSLNNGKMKSYEMEFLSLANSMGKTTGGLETIDFQISLFDDIPYEAQAEMLVTGIREQSSAESTSQDELTTLYLSQDVDAMSTYISSESQEMKGVEDKLVRKRNESWVQPILDQSRFQSVFFAVGAGHLGGNKGIIRLLRAAGYKVKPI
ncbi:MAG: TraB/GumN family protein [Saprospiraceae bacterium]|jgi:uncharacterized protein YbaP (TraB family)|nr:TraB/GumN family protein [Saprospiraceae bacterium]